MTEQTLHYWIALKQVSGIGAVLYKRLIENFKTPEAVFSADEEALWAVEGISESVTKNILTFKNFDSAKREVEKIEKDGVTLLTLNDANYPALLLEIYDPPPILYCKGRENHKNLYPVAMVGTRNMTSYGKSVAEKISGDLARVGITIVSGFARGVDATAHRAAIMAGGSTVAVLGCGIDVVYPREHKKLYDEILENGVIFSEFPMGTHPEPHYFPQRNRTISGLSLGCVVCEASTKSGSLITARFAMEQGREVFAVPGSIFSETSKGVHSLLASGAKLVADVQDILKELLPQLKANPSSLLGTAKAEPLPLLNPVLKEKKVLPILNGDEDKIYQFISLEPKQINKIIEESLLVPSVVSYCLLGLELKGVVRQLGGQFFIRTV